MAKKEQQPEKPRETTVEFLASLAGVLVTGLFIITFVIQAFEIPSASMENTLLIGDHVFVNRVQFSPATRWVGPIIPYSQIHRGDIVVFLSPAEPDLYVVKRIMGVPGDRIHLRDGVVYRNGEKLNEPYMLMTGADPYNPYRDNFPAVPPSEYSNVTSEWKLTMPQRYWGFIPRENVIGRPMFIYWSFETPENQYQKKEMSERAKFLANVVIHFFDKTRWSRTLKAVR